MSFFSKLMPTRFQNETDFEVIADVDDVITKSIGFKLHGKAHRINPMTTKQFFEWSNALAKLWELKDQKSLATETLIDGWFQVIHSMCPTITKKDIADCEQSQIAALYSILLEHATGKAHLDEKKKTTKKQPPRKSLRN